MRAESATPFDRRRFLVVGGTSLSFAALIAACASTNNEIPVSGVVEQPDQLTQPPITNAVYLRTSSSVVHNAIDAYGRLLDLGVLSADDEALVRYIRDQQTQQAKLLEDATTALGGQAYDAANPAVAKSIVEPALSAMDKAGNDPQDILRYVNAFETYIGATLQGFVPNVTVPDPRELMMKIAAVDNRHSAVVTSRIDGFTILAPENLAAVATTTTTTPPSTRPPSGGSAAPPPAAPLPVAQVPGAYASLAAVEVVLGGEDLTWETPGPNAYVYEETATTAP